jgi:hypothetical protein
MWMLLAADGGDSAARFDKAIVARRLNPTQIGAAHDLSQQWRMRHRSRPGAATR